MFFAEGQIRVHLYGVPADMRKSYDGLQALTRHAMGQDPSSGCAVRVRQPPRQPAKCLYFDRSGFCLWGKRLERGRFIGDWSRVRTQEMDWTALKLLIEGMESAPGAAPVRTPGGDESAVNNSTSATRVGIIRAW